MRSTGSRLRATFIHELELPYLAPSLGGVETLVSHPATVSYYDLTREERLSIGITDELVRYAAGIEDSEGSDRRHRAGARQNLILHAPVWFDSSCL